MKKRPHVALIVETSKQYGRSLIMGIARYLKGHGPWSIYIVERSVEEPVPRWLRNWDGDGIIARINDDDMARAVLATGVPVVNTFQFQTKLAMPAVWEDDLYLCELAFSHFAEHRFPAFAYCGWPHIPWAYHRGLHFAQVVKENGYGECHMYQPSFSGSRSWEQEQDDVASWLQSLPKPIAIMAANDVRGVQVLDACRRSDIPVPQQAAVLGVDNEPMLCELADPTLSSIDQDEESTGYEAAALLDRLMAGEKPPSGPLLIKALGVVARDSTDSMAVDDPDIAKALRFIRLHACDRISIDDVASHACLSRRVLQRRFKEILGHSPLDEIFAVQLNRIRQMLSETDLKLHAVAERAGFSYVGHLSSFFKAHTGITCGDFRRQAREAKTHRT